MVSQSLLHDAAFVLMESFFEAFPDGHFGHEKATIAFELYQRAKPAIEAAIIQHDRMQQRLMPLMYPAKN